MATRRPFGLWDSPISPRETAALLRLNDLAWAGDGETLVWVEGRGAQGVAVARRGADAPRDISGDLNVRGGVGYGGGELDVHGSAAFLAGKDGRIWRTELAGGAPRPITPRHGSVASPTVSPDGRWVVYVHSDGETDTLAAVDSHGRQWPWKIVVGADFYMQPAWSPDGSQLAWIAWDQPQMPWNGSRLETALVEFDERGFKLGPIDVWAGTEDVAVQQPEFSPDGRYLAYVSDETNHNNLWIRDLATGDARRLSSRDADIGGPAWVQGLRYYAWSLESKTIVAAVNHRGVMKLTRLSVDGADTELEPATSYTAIGQPAISNKGHIAFIGSAPVIPTRIVSLIDGDTPRIEQRASSERTPAKRLAKMQPVEWQLAGGTTIHANHYPPTNPRFEAAGRPPAIVRIHGGPTSQRTAAYDAQCQFFATRGFAVLDVNYRGSTGYGRDYMDLLEGNWGICDVEDAVAGAKFLVEADLAHPDKLVVMGGSAGGFTVLQALCDYPGAFAAGVCLYGVGNLFTLTMGTHKFEAAYNDWLLGPLPEAAETFRERSPVFKADRIVDPVAIYHGAEDKAVPPDQAEAIVESLRQRGVPHFFHMYPDEGHGFRRPENIEHFYDSLLAFLTEHVIFA